MAQHKVRKHHWEGRSLKTTDFFFDSLEEAVKFAKAQGTGTIKVYDDNNQLVHNLDAVATDTYA